MWSRRSISLQAYLYGRQNETRAFYEALQLVLQEEDKKNLERLIEEGSKLSEQLKKYQAEMIEKSINLRAMYDELMGMCLKPDEEMLKVGTEHVPGNFLYHQKTLLSLIYLVSKIDVFISWIYGREVLPIGNDIDKLLFPCPPT